MLFEDLATELVAHVFFSCASIDDVYSLAATCHRFRGVFASSRRLPILSSAAENEYGPLADAFQLVTHNASQLAYVRRSVPLSSSLLKQIVAVGRTAKQWQELYPFRKWKDKYEDRRLLSDAECWIFRRALYRLWLYSAAYHNPAHPRYSRNTPLVMQERARLLQKWPNEELAEIEDVRQIVRDVVRHKICPSNGTIQKKFHKRFPNSNHQLCFNVNVHLNYPFSPTNPPQQFFNHQHRQQHDAMHKFRPTMLHDPGFEGWGDDITHYYCVEDMMKLDPAQILWLKDNAVLKAQVEHFVKELGPWFDNNGETFGETLNWVLRARGEDAREFAADLEEGISGIAKVGWHADG